MPANTQHSNTEDTIKMPAIDGGLLQRAGDIVQARQPVYTGRVGRPTTYTKEFGEEICSLVASGLTLPKVSAIPGMPGHDTLWKWQLKHTEFADALARARDARIESWQHKIEELGERVQLPDGEGSIEFQRANIAMQAYEKAAKLQIARQPATQRLSLENPDGSPLLGDTRELAKALLAGLAGAGVTQIEGVLATYHELPSETPGFVVPATTLPQDGDLPSDV